MRAGMIALVLTGALISTSANAIVIFNSQYVVGPLVRPNTGVTVGDTVTVEAFYDPLFATLQLENSYSTIHSFDAEHAGLRFTVGDLVWQTTGPLSIQTTLTAKEGGFSNASIGFIGDTNNNSEGMVSTTLSTPWDADITGIAWMSFIPRFTIAGDITAPQLFDEQDIGSILLPELRVAIGGAYANTADGGNFFNFSDPEALGLPPIPSVPEPGTLGLFGLAAAGLLVRRVKTKVVAA